MRHVTDIPDWCDYQAFGKLCSFDFGAVTSDEELKQLRKMSPIAYVDKGTSILSSFSLFALNVLISDIFNYDFSESSNSDDDRMERSQSTSTSR